VEVPSGVEMACLSDDLLLDLVVVNVTSKLNEQDRRWTSGAYNDALLDKVSARSTNIVFNGSVKIQRSKISQIGFI
jgi:hypothetical protein